MDQRPSPHPPESRRQSVRLDQHVRTACTARSTYTECGGATQAHDGNDPARPDHARGFQSRPAVRLARPDPINRRRPAHPPLDPALKTRLDIAKHAAEYPTKVRHRDRELFSDLRQ